MPLEKQEVCGFHAHGANVPPCSGLVQPGMHVYLDSRGNVYVNVPSHWLEAARGRGGGNRLGLNPDSTTYLLVKTWGEFLGIFASSVPHV